MSRRKKTRVWDETGLVEHNDRPQRKMQGSKVVNLIECTNKKQRQLKPAGNRPNRTKTSKIPGRGQLKRCGNT